MKLIFAIINNEDIQTVMDELNRNDFRATKLCSTGGFLRVGNTTLIVGVDEDKVERVLDIIKKNSKSRRKLVSSIAPDGFIGASEVTTGGATIFLMDVERFEKF